MADLFSERIQITFPRQHHLDGLVQGNRVQQIAELAETEMVSVSPFASRQTEGWLCERNAKPSVLLLSKRTSAQLPGQSILVVANARSADEAASRAGFEGAWLRPSSAPPLTLDIRASTERIEAVRASWKGALTLKGEVRDSDGKIVEAGLRPPQIGAVHAALAHWSVAETPATIVMPTGTGKTETMLALTVHTRPTRLLVVVPNSALRDQIAEKFLTLGKLSTVGCLAEGALLPAVATLRHRPTSLSEVDELFGRANVVVTTMQVVGQCEPAVQAKIADVCSHLFIDEAHHIAAKTWRQFKSVFASRIVLQFTATPFRTDGKRVDGKFIYVYPLAKAQSEGYFRPIKFKAVQGLEQAASDAEIIRLVGEQLRSDLAEGCNHLAMARADSIPRATALHAKYEKELPEYRPILIHSKMSAIVRQQALAALRAQQSRIIVCVDMLGEGFDLPELKIAALHDRHKSIAITLQFTGRFTRDAQDIGDATVIANIEQDDIDAALRTLYAEDADWNFLLTVLSETRTSRQIRRAEILSGFGEGLRDIPLQTLNPRMNAVVYRTDISEWRPDRIEEAFASGTIHSGPVINDERRMALFVTREEFPVRWSSSKTILDTEWHLFLVHWNPDTKLLYIASSRTDELHERLAKAAGGSGATRISGETIYRSLAGINRLVLMNLGLSQVRSGKAIRYMMFAGSDIARQLPDAATGTKRKTNLFGQGFDGDGKVTIGCSAKGKIWSMQSAADFSEWVDWCHSLGTKLTDETIKTDQFIRTLIKQEEVTERPTQAPISIHWPEGLLQQLEERIELRFGATSTAVSFYECDIDLSHHSETTPLRFIVSTDTASAEFEVEFVTGEARYRQISGPIASILVSKKERPLSEVLGEDPPPIHFAGGDFLVANELFKLPPPDTRRVFDPAKLEAIAWKGWSEPRVVPRLNGESVTWRRTCGRADLPKNRSSRSWPSRSVACRQRTSVGSTG